MRSRSSRWTTAPAPRGAKRTKNTTPEMQPGRRETSATNRKDTRGAFRLPRSAQKHCRAALHPRRQAARRRRTRARAPWAPLRGTWTPKDARGANNPPEKKSRNALATTQLAERRYNSTPQEGVHPCRREGGEDAPVAPTDVDEVGQAPTRRGSFGGGTLGDGTGRGRDCARAQDERTR